ncbi:hypothetical protein WJX81_008506 [Elliptochloris bilobata]|uniref:AP2/ERF domain-containing protein n=1 Tax=Elliptochloris bilobata TaxID=381761 RepID=A0AAW1RTQ5_9CHLO
MSEDAGGGTAPPSKRARAGGSPPGGRKEGAPVQGAARGAAGGSPAEGSPGASVGEGGDQPLAGEDSDKPRGPLPRTSKFKGVTKHRRSGRWEAHVWVREEGKQAYLGGYSTEEEAAEAHDVAALKCHGLRAKTNFHLSRYAPLLDCLDQVPMSELVMAIRRQSQGFTRGSSAFRGVTQHKTGRWEVRIGLKGSKHVYLGLHTSEVDAAKVYDRALVLLTGQAAATNFPSMQYTAELAEFEERERLGLKPPGMVDEGEPNERAFEAWLRDAAIIKAPEPSAAPPPPPPKPSGPVQLGRDGGERRASAVAASTVWRRDAAEEATENFQRPGREAPKPRTKRRGQLAADARESQAGRPTARVRRGRPKGGGRGKAQRLAADRDRDREADTDMAEILATLAGMPASGFASADPDTDMDPDVDPSTSDGRGGAGVARAWEPPGAPEMVFWLGLVSAVGQLTHSMLGVPKRPHLPPASPDVHSQYWVPKYPELQFPAGDKVEVVVALHNLGSTDLNVTNMQGSLNSVQNFAMYFQNFTEQRQGPYQAGLPLKAGEALSLSYWLMPDPSLPPREFQVAVTAFYQTPDAATQFSTTFFNQTIDIVETKKLVDVELISLYATILALMAGVGYVVYSNVAGMAVVKNATKGKQKKKADPAPKVDTDGSEWLKGTNVNFGDAKAKQRPKTRVVAEPATALVPDAAKAT